MCLAIPGRLVQRLDDDPIVPMGRVRFGGILREVCLACVPEARVGDWLLVHAGMALTRVDEAAAAETLRLLAEAGASEDPP